MFSPPGIEAAHLPAVDLAQPVGRPAPPRCLVFPALLSSPEPAGGVLADGWRGVGESDEKQSLEGRGIQLER